MSLFLHNIVSVPRALMYKIKAHAFPVAKQRHSQVDYFKNSKDTLTFLKRDSIGLMAHSLSFLRDLFLDRIQITISTHIPDSKQPQSQVHTQEVKMGHIKRSLEVKANQVFLSTYCRPGTSTCICFYSHEQFSFFQGQANRTQRQAAHSHRDKYEK